MINYLSTRGNKKEYTFSEALLKGIADDGGLFMPSRIPKLSLAQINNLQNKSYQEIALFVMKLLETDFPESVLHELINKAYADNFDDPQIAPLKQLNKNQYVLELWHGPTAAFKDMALQLMPLLFSYALNLKKDKPRKYLILVATSGDTGAAALEGYKNKKNIKTIVLYPENQVSQIQELTMTTFKADNAKVFAIKSDFDNCQTTVKNIFNDQKFNQKLLQEYETGLSAANSINWGRLLPQFFYYLSTYVHLLEQKKIKLGDQIDVSIPSGNFGNLFAAYFMRSCGLPIRKFLCASNTNNILTEFFQTGIFDISARSIFETPSPSMNILISSNLERFLFMVTQDSRQVKQWMEDLKEKKRFSVDNETRIKMDKFIFSNWVNNTGCLTSIQNTFKETGYLIDPHTAVAMEVANRFKLHNKGKKEIPMIICATAHWSKFPQDVYKALFGETKEKDTFKLLSQIQKKAKNSRIHQSISLLQKKPKNHIPVYQSEKEVIEEAIIEFLCGAR